MSFEGFLIFFYRLDLPGPGSPGIRVLGGRGLGGATGG